MAPWKFGYRTALLAHPKHWDLGTWLVNLASTIQLIGFTMSDIVLLRTLSICSSTLWIIFYIRQLRILGKAMRVPLAWVTTFFFVHSTMLAVHLIRNSDTGMRFTREEMDLFEEHFLPTGMKPRHFRKLLNVAIWVDYPKGADIVHERDPLSCLAIIVKGRVVGYKNGVRLQAISSFPGAKDLRPAGDAGAWIGDIGWLEDFSKRTRMRKNSTATDRQLEEGQRIAQRMRQEVEIQSSQLEAMVRGENELEAAPSSAVAQGAPKPAEQALARKRAAEGNGKVLDKAIVGRADATSILRPYRNWPNPTLEPPVQICRGTPKALYTYRAKTSSRALVFHHSKLEALLQSDPELKTAFLASATAAVVGKIVNLSDQTALQHYRENLRAVLFNGKLLPEEKKFLREFRRKHAVTYEEHIKMLNTLGWSEDEFNDGAQARTLRGVEKKTYERIQRRKSTLLRHDTELQELAEDHDAVDDGSQ